MSHDPVLNNTEGILPTSPEHLGFDPERLERAFRLLDATVEQEHIPGIVALVGRGDRYVNPYTVGWAAVKPERILLTDDAVFDMASVTKVVTTTTAVLQLMEAGVWRLDDPVARLWPEFTPGITLRHLLTHTSGLPAWRAVYETGEGPEHYRKFLQNVSLEYETGSRVVYSCLGFLVLADLVERVTGEPFDTYCIEYIFKPLGMADSGYNPPADIRARCAMTEIREGSDRPLQGIVHDENARCRGGVAGNAGLFSTAQDMARFCYMIINGGTYRRNRILSEASIRLATQDHTAHLNDSRGLGWVVKGERTHSSAGDFFSPQAFGHTGFTGTSIWLDPTRDLYAVLLTNRVHPVRENNHHIRLRALFHNAVVAAIEV